MLSGLHILLTYQCVNECDHCFLYCGPRMEGTFTLERIERALDQAVDAAVETVYLEGGEPFLYYPLMIEAARLVKARGLGLGIVTNCYWALSERDAQLWLAPFVEIGIDDLSVSDDAFHSEDPEHSLAKIALRAARALGLAAASICITEPRVLAAGDVRKGEPVIGGDVVFKGRAVEKLIGDLPRRRFDCFTECTQEELARPSRVHLDPFGNIFVCQGLSIGNIWEMPLVDMIRDYAPDAHPIVGPLLSGGPAELARRYGLPSGEDYVSECHLCYLVRKSLLDRYPEYLCPRQVYGLSAG
jgi:hypothetical protein